MKTIFAKKLGRLVILGALTAILSQGALAQEIKKARLGHAYNVGHPVTTSMDKFAADVAKATNNKVRIQVFSGSTLGGEDKMWQAVQSGTQEFAFAGSAPLTGKIKEYQIFDFPFLFNNADEVYAVLNGPVGQKMLAKTDPLKMVGLAWAHIGFRNLTNNKRPVVKADDIAGLKVRVMQNPVALDAWKAFGANAVPMSFSEVFVALETGALDAQENPLGHITTFKLHEVQKYLTITNHVETPGLFAVSKKFWDTLTPAERDAIKIVTADTMKTFAKLTAEADASLLNEVKKFGMQISVMPPAEIVKMQEKSKPVIEKYTASIGSDFVTEFTGEIRKARSGK